MKGNTDLKTHDVEISQFDLALSQGVERERNASISSASVNRRDESKHALQNSRRWDFSIGSSPQLQFRR